MDETELQHRLTRLAERTAPPPREFLAEVVVARHRTQRRQAVGFTTLIAVVAALVVASATLLPDGPAAEPAVASGEAVAAVDVFAGPTRGSLAGDAAFVEGVRQLDWTSPDSSGNAPEAPLDSRRVVFAGDVAGGRWALVAGDNTTRPVGAAADPDRQTDLGALSDVAMAWFSGPPGATAEQMQPDGVPYGVDPQLPVARADSSTGALVVLTAPGDAVEVSARPDIAADGSVTREWVPVDPVDGVVVTTIPATTSAYSTAVRYRVVRDGVPVAESVPDGRSNAATVPDPVAVTWLRTPPADPEDWTVRSAVDDVLAQTGLSAGDVTAAALWAGDVPGPHDRTARVTLLAVTLPSGAVYLTAPFAWADGTGGEAGGSCGSAVEAAGVALEDRALAVRCDVYDGAADAETASSVVVLSPGASTARAVDMTGVALADFPVVDGVGIVSAPERVASVIPTGADGTPGSRLRLLSSADLGD